MSDDLISRLEAYERIKDPSIQALNEVPNIQSEQKTGFWAYKESGIYYCSICGRTVMSDAISPYCPNCGAKMKWKCEGENDKI